jgi:protein TonB
VEFPPTDVPSGPIAGDLPPGPAVKSGDGTLAPPADPQPGTFVYADEMPAKIRCADAVYPDLARSAGVEGTVRVLMLVGLNGHVERAIIAPKGSVPMLDQAALDAALTCVFTPALANGHPVKVWVSQSYHFALHSAR